MFQLMPSFTMLRLLISLIILIIFSIGFILSQQSSKANYDRPVIGIVTLPVQDSGNSSSPSNFPASYVKFIESAGARSLPVFIGRDENYYKSIMDITNGILFTGGGTNLSDSIYTSSASIIWSYAKQLNEKGDYYPIWGTCQGFELFLHLANDQDWPLVNCSAINLAQRLTFLLDEKQLTKTRIFQNAPDFITQSMANQPVTYNWHNWCLPIQSLNLPKLKNFFIGISESVDYTGLKFISMIEAFDYPFYGVQFHPEKPAYEPVIDSDYSNTPRSTEAILIGQYFANFFINEAKRNHHVYPETDFHRSQLIYNYCPKYTGITADGSNIQTYYFD